MYGHITYFKESSTATLETMSWNPLQLYGKPHENHNGVAVGKDSCQGYLTGRPAQLDDCLGGRKGKQKLRMSTTPAAEVSTTTVKLSTLQGMKEENRRGDKDASDVMFMGNPLGR